MRGFGNRRLPWKRGWRPGVRLTVVAFGWAMAGLLAAEAGVGQEPAVARGAVAVDHANEIQAARRLVRTLMEEQAIPGMSVAVGTRDRILWSEGFGFSDLEGGVPVNTLTRFRIGSVSKPLTAAGLAKAMEAGDIDLDAPVQTYVADFPAKRWPITTRQLTGHLAGIRHYGGAEEFLSSRRYATVDDALEIFARDSLLFEPGARFSYSSYGWNLVSAVLEGASGRRFLDLMYDEVLEPLGMIHTIADHTDSIIPHRTRFYAKGEDGRIVNATYVDNSNKWAGGGFLSTPEDLLRFGAAHLEAGFLTEATLDRLFTSQRTQDGEETGYGIGWSTDHDEFGDHIVSHGGGSVGGITILWVNRTQGLVVAAVANLSEARLGEELARRIAHVFLGRASS